jgi:hypothetical protein
LINLLIISMNPRFIRSILSLIMLSLLSPMINIEILYEIFHLFLQKKNEKNLKDNDRNK